MALWCLWTFSRLLPVLLITLVGGVLFGIGALPLLIGVLCSFRMIASVRGGITSWTLGRAGVALALQLLSRKALIRATRGSVVIVDRDGLEKMSNGAYGKPEAEFQRCSARLHSIIAISRRQRSAVNFRRGNPRNADRRMGQRA
jgi:hypothetical protein